jgi:GDP-mannose 4,6 dehydratase
MCSCHWRRRVHWVAHGIHPTCVRSKKSLTRLQVVELIESGYNVVVLDNLHNSSTEAIRRIEAIVRKTVPLEQVDLTDFDAVRQVFAKYPVDSVIHFAGLKVRIVGVRTDEIGCWGKRLHPSGILSRQCEWKYKLDQGNGGGRCENLGIFLLGNRLRRRYTV